MGRFLSVKTSGKAAQWRFGETQVVKQERTPSQATKSYPRQGLAVSGRIWPDVEAAKYSKMAHPNIQYVVATYLIVGAKEETSPWQAQLRAIRTIDAECVASLDGFFSPLDPEELSQSNPSNIVIRIILAEAISAMRRIRPDVAAEFKEKANRQQKQNRLSDPAHTVLESIFNEKAFLSRSRPRLKACFDSVIHWPSFRAPGGWSTMLTFEEISPNVRQFLHRR